MIKNQNKYSRPKIKTKRIKTNFYALRRSLWDSYDELLMTDVLAFPGCGCCCRTS